MIESHRVLHFITHPITDNKCKHDFTHRRGFVLFNDSGNVWREYNVRQIIKGRSVSGLVDNQEIIIRGQAMIYNFDLISQQVVVDISGNSTAEVHAEDSLDVTIAGMGNIR